MRQGTWRLSPALVMSALALFVALGGTVYAAKKAQISGKAIRTKSLPGNRLKLHSVPANRLKPGALDGGRITSGPVPEATHAETADTARSATDAQTALNAVNAIDAKTVNGHSVGCLPGTAPFAGACWESTASSKVSAPVAASKCAARNGTLPEALQLAAFAEQPGVNLDAGDEWSSDIPVFSGLNTYGVATVSAAGEVNSVISTTAHAYRCVIPLVT